LAKNGIIEITMNIILHDTQDAYLEEYRRVRARLIERGSSVADWCRRNGYDRQLVIPALKGQSFGKKALEARAKLLRDALANG